MAYNNVPLEHLVVYVSIPIFSKIRQYEEGTAAPEERCKNFIACKKYRIQSVLYIKPFIEEVTDNDIDNYNRIVQSYKIPVVVGDFLTVNEGDFLSDVGEKKLYEERTNNKQFVSSLGHFMRVYNHSVDVIEQMRKEGNEAND